MSQQIFVNLPVADLPRSMEFFSALGFSFDPRFTDENAACLVIDPDHIYAMLITHEFFGNFTKKPLADASVIETITSITTDSRDDVDAFAEKALAAGAGPALEPSDMGFMYTRSFLDPDGHQWEIFWMDPSGPPV